MAQDSGAILGKIIELRQNLKFSLEIKHVSQVDGSFEFLVNPEQFMINRRNAISKTKRAEIENTLKIVYLDDMENTINKSVN